MRRIVTLMLAASATIATTAEALASESPKAVRASIIAAALSEHSVHWMERDVVGAGVVEAVADVTPSAGNQVVTVVVGKQIGSVQIVFINHTDYVNGEAFGLEANLGLTKAQAKQYEGKWISITKGDKAYAPVASGLTMASIVHGMTPRGTLKSFTRNVHGTRIVVVEATSGTGTKRKLESVAAHARGKPLPIEAASITPSTHALTHLDFSRWNERVHVQAPRDPTPIATVRAG
jgi:hypothetical protein